MPRKLNIKNQTERIYAFDGGELRIRIPGRNSRSAIANSREGTAAEARAETAGEEAAEIMVYDVIGSDPWGGRGLTAEMFRNALKEIPRERELHVRVNSRGGDVHEGMAIKNCLDEWPKKVTATIDGVAASTASWMILGADQVRAPKTSQMFIHDAMGLAMGNAEEMRSLADSLDKTSDQIAGIYADKTGKGVRTMRQMMKEETLLTGEEAAELGLVDELVDGKAVRNFGPEEITQMRNRLAAIYNRRGGDGGNSESQIANSEGGETIMNRDKIIALLKKHGVTQINNVAIDEKTTMEQLETALETAMANRQSQIANSQTQPPAAVPGAAAGTPASAGPGLAEIQELKNQISQLTEANNAAKKLRITALVEKWISDDKLPAGKKNETINEVMGNERLIAIFDALPSNPPGGEPLRPTGVEVTGDSIADVQTHILNNGPRLMARFTGANAGRVIDAQATKALNDGALVVANTLKKHRTKLVEMFNANVIDADLQRIVILSDLLRAFARRLLPLRAFCTSFTNVPLEGTDKVAVPYFALDTIAATDWVAATGYVAEATAQSVREVTINKRKYKGLAFSSSELRRQPYQNWAELAALKAERLAVDVNQDVLSVVTAANYGAAAKTTPAAAFTADDIADLYVAATDANWPDTGRCLVLTSAYKGALLKDPSFKQYLAYGSDAAIRRAEIQEAYGFTDIFTVPSANFPANSENLVGFINHKAAALVATAPIMPAPAVRAVMVQYDLVVDPDTGVAIEYRKFGNAQLDVQNEFVECNYGYAKGVETALQRIVSG
jgi:ATP-dependent protease ClpP protease subunit